MLEQDYEQSRQLQLSIDFSSQQFFQKLIQLVIIETEELADEGELPEGFVQISKALVITNPTSGGEKEEETLVTEIKYKRYSNNGGEGSGGSSDTGGGGGANRENVMATFEFGYVDESGEVQRTTVDVTEEFEAVPTTAFPTFQPSHRPTTTPSSLPTPSPTIQPSRTPTDTPSSSPTNVFSGQPTIMPSADPSAAPSGLPSLPPSDAPSLDPSGAPSSIPSLAPSDAPSVMPSGAPSDAPSSGKKLKMFALSLSCAVLLTCRCYHQPPPKYHHLYPRLFPVKVIKGSYFSHNCSCSCTVSNHIHIALQFHHSCRHLSPVRSHRSCHLPHLHQVSYFLIPG